MDNKPVNVYPTPSSWITAGEWFQALLRELRKIEEIKKNG